MSKDYVVRATAANQMIRAFAVDVTETTAEAQTRHNTSPVITAALGRLLAAAAMMGSGMKGEEDILTLMVRSEGPAKGFTVTANSKGEVKGYPLVPQVELPPKSKGKLDVGGALGHGTLTVIMDLGLKEPYSGQVELQTGEIGDDLTYYFAVSEQTPSSVGVGVMIDKDLSVKHAGGFIIQLMPDASEEVIEKLEDEISKMEPVTTLMDRGMTPEEILETILGSLELTITEKLPIKFYCNCSQDRVSKALATLKDSELQEMIDDGEEIEVKCHFCNSDYHFSVEDIKSTLMQRREHANE